MKAQYSKSQKIIGIVAACVIVAVIAVFVWAYKAMGPKPAPESEWPSTGQCEGVAKVLVKKHLYELEPDQRRIFDKCIEHGYVLRKEAERSGQ